MTSILKLIRLPNLVMLMMTVLLYGKCILYPAFATYDITPKFTSKDFLSLLFVFTCVAAGGYIHNDITDIKTDHTNDKRQVVGKKIKHSAAWLMYFFLIFAPLPLVYYLCTEIENLNYITYYFIVIGLLFIYNKWLQRWPLIGNLIVASACGLIIALPALAESTAFHAIKSYSVDAYHKLYITTIGFVIFSFLSNLIREIVKDIEDMEGDKNDGYKTLPIVISVKSTKYILISIQLILAFCILFWLYIMMISFTIKYFLAVFLVAPLFFIIYATAMASNTTHFASLSNKIKYYFGVGLIAFIIVS